MNTRRLIDCPHCGNFVRLAANPAETTCPFCGDGVCIDDGCATGHGPKRRIGVRVTRLLLGPAAATVLAACYGLPEDPYPWDAEFDVPIDGDTTIDTSPGDAGTDPDTDADTGDPDAADSSGDAADVSETDTSDADATDADAADGSGEGPDASDTGDADGSGEAPDADAGE